MTATEFVNAALRFTAIKPIWNQLEFGQMGFVEGKAKSKKGRWLDIWAGVFLSYKHSCPLKEETDSKKEKSRLLLTNFLSRKRTGVRGYKGYFTLVDFRKN